MAFVQATVTPKENKETISHWFGLIQILLNANMYERRKKSWEKLIITLFFIQLCTCVSYIQSSEKKSF